MTITDDSIQVADDLLLEPIFVADPDHFLRLIVKNMDQNSPWLLWSRPGYSRDDLNRYLSEQAAKRRSNESREYTIRWDSMVIGAVGLYALGSPNKCPGIGYWLDADFQGRGITTRSASALIDIAFEKFDANLVHANAATENKRSRALAERIGMRLDGILRQRDRNQQGDFLDVAYYSISREEWRDLQRRISD